MKRLLAIAVAVLFYFESYADKYIDGVYYNDGGIRLEIFDDRFIFVANTHLGNSGPIILTEASYVWSNNNFIRLVQSPNKLIDESVKIVQSRDSTVKDSIKVTLLLPNLETSCMDIKLIVKFNNGRSYWDGPWWQTYKFVPADKNDYKCVMVPLFTNLPLSLDVFIAPSTLKPVSVDYGSGYYSSFYNYSYSIKWYNKIGLNRIDIEIPNLDDGYFGRYYVNGDYVRVVGDKLYWRGRVFEKSYAPEDIRYIEEKESALKK